MTRKSELPQVRPELADLAFVDAAAMASAAGISISKVHQMVRDGHAPAPAIRLPRYSRWRLADVREWLRGLPAEE
jgi:predicted DNA-binding transcriptional regulator AlpA